MCGVTGYARWGSLIDGDVDVISRMTRELDHRGPDGSGRWIGTHAAMGHTRLSIIDIAGGTQPMSMRGQHGKDLVISYNGELYNFRELREQLRGRGRRFVSQSDTEVVLQAFDEWGPSCVDRFTGMFAFAIWDDGARKMTLARDALGVKPLFFVHSKGQLVFGSEEKAILAHPDIEPVLDEAGLAELYCLPPMANRHRTVLRDLRQVAPGHIMTFGATGVTSRCFWKLEARPHEDDVQATAGQLRELLQESVRGQLVSDLEVGTILSGGVDSSSVAALAARHIDGKLATFDVDYVSVETNYTASALQVDRDSPWAWKVADHIGSAHQSRMCTTADLLAAHETTLRAWGRPMHRLLCVSMYLLFQHIRDNGIVVVQGGEGADEAFGGYAWWRDAPVEHFPWFRTYPDSSILLRPEIRERSEYRNYAQDSYAEARARIPRLAGESSQDRYAREVTWLTYTFYLDFLLHRVDRMSMAASVEARVPFCDHNLVQYAWNIPWDMKNHRGIEKGILRTAVRDLLPADVAMRPKSGYPVSQTGDYQRASSLAIRELIADRDARVWQMVDPKVVAELTTRTSHHINSDWTDLNRVSYVLETDLWLRTLGVRLDF